MKTVVISGKDTLRKQMLYVWQLVVSCIEQGPVEIRVDEAKKSRLMEKKYHAMFRDVAAQVSVPVLDFERNVIQGQTRKYEAEYWKAFLVNLYERELISMGESLKSPSKAILCPYTLEKISIRASTSEFRKSEAGGFIEFLYKFGTENNVTWSDDYMRFWKEYGARW